jgi:hypothetical protein
MKIILICIKNFQEYILPNIKNLIDNGNTDIGQYLSGVDKRNMSGDTRGFVNETCIVKYNRNKFIWVKDEITSLYTPHINIDNKYIPIFNLHIHSKNLKDFMSLKPNEDKFINIYK